MPLLLASLRVAAVPDRDGSRVPNARRAVWSLWIVLGALSALVFGSAVLSKGDAYLAATHAVSFGRSYAGHDVSYYVFQLPLQVWFLHLASFALVLLAIASGIVYAVAEQRRRGSLVHAGDARRAGDVVVAVTFVYGGLALRLPRPRLLPRSQQRPGRRRRPDQRRRQGDARRARCPSQAVIGVMIVLLGVATCALALARLRRHLFLTTFRMAYVAAASGSARRSLLTVLVTFWWTVLVAFAVAVSRRADCGLVAVRRWRTGRTSPRPTARCAAARSTAGPTASPGRRSWC